jgi:hypothetical protein
VRAGQLRRGSEALPPEFWSRELPADAEGRLLQALLDEREAGR